MDGWWLVLIAIVLWAAWALWSSVDWGACMRALREEAEGGGKREWDEVE